MTIARRFFSILALLCTGVFTAQSATIATNAAASLVLGQSTFTTNDTTTPATPGSLNLPTGITVDATTGKVFVADETNNRVLRYANQKSLTNGAAPELVIGQINFSNSAANQGNATPSQTSLSAPNDVFIDTDGRLWIADTGNSRVLMFENAANLSGGPAAADRVFGQPDFVTATANHTQSTLGNPRGVCVDPSGTLWVADTGSHRVMGWKNAATLANGANATRVVGQPNFTDNTAGTSQNRMFNPWGVAANASQLWVADRDNNRVLLFSNYPTINFPPANLVLGQTNYTGNTAATSAAGLTHPTSVAISGTSIWVCDDGNNRILNYPSTTTLAPGAPATVVVGQATLTTGSAGLSSQKLSLQNSHIAVDSFGSLYVADRLNNRALRFSSSSAVPTPTPSPTPVATIPTVTITAERKITTTKATYTLRGTAAAGQGILRVSYDLNENGYIRAKGTTSWKAKIKLPYGRNKITVNSVATNGAVSAPAKVTITRE